MLNISDIKVLTGYVRELPFKNTFISLLSIIILGTRFDIPQITSYPIVP